MNRSAVTYRLYRPAPPGAGGAATGGGSAVIPPAVKRYFAFLYAFAAADSSFLAIPLAFFGFLRKSWNSPHSP